MANGENNDWPGAVVMIIYLIMIAAVTLFPIIFLR